MNTATWNIIVAIIILAVLDIMYIANHGLDSCGGNCSHCSGRCKWVGDVNKAKKAIARKKRIRAFLHMDKAK